MLKNTPEWVQGDKSLRLNLYIVIASYLLIVVLVEPAIDLLLLLIFEQQNLAAITLMNKVKLLASTLLYVVLGLMPASFASWFGYRVLASSKLPPVLLSGKTQFPFTVVVIKGKTAKMFGGLIIIVALALIFQLFLHLFKVVLL